ncbi:MAG TPA: TrkH family potassium uptake protein [Syntrophomonas sp.]|nr:TrkH family potassium uptake protein [Syntrophomonas sp.]
MNNRNFTAPQLLVVSFFSVILLGSLLLSLPCSSYMPTPYLDALFTSTSAVCVTGLVVVDTGTHWTYLGQTIIMLLIQIGGLGVMSFAGLFAFLMGRKIFLRERLLMQQTINVSAVGGIVKIFRYLLGFTFLVEALGALILAIRWTPLMGLKKALWFGLFHSISAFNNAGFDLFGNFKSLTEFNADITVNMVISSLIIVGGLGFYVCYELFNYRQAKKLSLHSKVVLRTTIILILTGTVLLFVNEYHHAFKDMALGTKLLAAYFQSVSPRTAGFNTVDLNSLLLPSQLLLIILMFIGASPGSTGGGIKTTTLAIIVATVSSQLQGKRDTQILERRIENSAVYQAVTVVILYAFVLLLITYLLTLTDSASLIKTAFEVASALGTVGLSLGLTTSLSEFGKILIIFTMFLGRVGPLTLGFALASRKKQTEIRYAKGKIMIG